ncbi:MAG: hypothetical protein CFK52_11485 [Chloracidobacterium sp. CP2_5A]|nr:MAG: hypothetical protein CFK52_11485 [Chloracidobacterium sp. CP2_5A]
MAGAEAMRASPLRGKRAARLEKFGIARHRLAQLGIVRQTLRRFTLFFLWFFAWQLDIQAAYPFTGFIDKRHD